MGVLFGTDGIRGEAGKYPLDIPTIEQIGHSLASRLNGEAGGKALLILGRDTRESGIWIEEAIVRGITLAGAEVLSAGVIPTPGVAFLTRDLRAKAGIVISASHNPYQDNGIKIFSPSGRKLSDEMETSIENDILGLKGSPLPVSDLLVSTDSSLTPRYLSYLKAQVGSGLSLAGMKIVLDCANGAASELAPALFRELGASVVVLNADPDGRNINEGCGALHPELLQLAVRDSGAEIGFAFDGDADRLILVDNQGALLDGDFILFLLATYFSDRQLLSGNRVVATVMSNLGLELALREHGIDLARTSVGDKYVLEELIDGGGSIGGEQSGHIIFPEISLAGDGMITALEILRAVIESGRPVSHLAGGMKRLPQILLNVKVGRKPALANIPEISDAIAALEKGMEGSGRILVRYSGTENIARIMIEGRDEETIMRQADSLAHLLRQYLA